MRWVLCCCLLVSACGVDDDAADATGARDAAVGCARAGAAEPCACDAGAAGQRVCLGEAGWSTCRCGLTRTLPCAEPGTAFQCFCGDAGVGFEVCRADGRYTVCDCSAETAGVVDDAGPPDVAAPAAAVCPAPFVCVAQQGVNVCADGAGVPPFCAVAADCASAGLPLAECLDPGVGVTLCVQFCDP